MNDPFLQAAIDEARKGLAEGGIPIGSVLVLDDQIIGRGHNRRVQDGSVIHHAEMNCLENAGRLPASVYRRCTIYSTFSPCPMCSGRGQIKTARTVCYEVLREIQREAGQFSPREFRIVAAQSVVDLLLEEEAAALAQLCDTIGRQVSLHVETLYSQEQYDIVLM